MLLGLFATGRDKRAYATLAAGETVLVGGRQVSAEGLAESCSPQMHLHSETPSPPLLWTFYEVVPDPGGGFVDVVYYFVWENEINPNPAIHRLYSLFRAAYYGYPVYDIEYLQVRIESDSRRISDILFETATTSNYFETVKEHIVARYAAGQKGRFDETMTDQAGAPLSHREGVELFFEDHHVKVVALTWNHLTRLFGPAQDQNARLLPYELK